MDDPQNQKITVILADDHPMLRAGFISSLADYPDIEVVGETGDIEEVPELFNRLHPAVAVLDIMFGARKTGLSAIQQLIKVNPKAKVVALSQFDQDTMVREAYKFGAMAFITKDADIEQLVQAIRKAHQGKRHYLPHIAERLAEMATRPAPSPFDEFAQRELDVLGLIGEGKITRDIATELGFSPRTVAEIMVRLKTKLGVKRRHELIPIGHQYNAQRS